MTWPATCSLLAEGKLQQEVERLLVTLLERSARRQAAASLPQEATHA